MRLLSLILVGLVAVEHLYFLYLEMFAWTKPATRRAFGLTAEFAAASTSLAAKPGPYTRFLAAWRGCSLASPDPSLALALAVFFLALGLCPAASQAATASYVD